MHTSLMAISDLLLLHILTYTVGALYGIGLLLLLTNGGLKMFGAKG